MQRTFEELQNAVERLLERVSAERADAGVRPAPGRQAKTGDDRSANRGALPETGSEAAELIRRAIKRLNSL